MFIPPRLQIQAFSAAPNFNGSGNNIAESEDQSPEWRPPLPDFIEQYKMRNLPTISSSTSQSNSEVVQTFVQISASRASVFNTRNNTQDGDDLHDLELGDLNEITRLLESRVPGFTHEELLLGVKALTCWPEVRRHRRSLLSVPTRIELNLRKIFDLFSLECERRLHTKKCAPEHYISITYSNIGNVLELCELWKHIDLIDSYKAKSFCVTAVNRIGDAESNSKSKFRYMQKDIYLRFIAVMLRCELSATFHKYYCMIKFLDLLPEMNVQEIKDICYVFLKQKLFGPTNHPLEVKLRQDIMKKLLENQKDITSTNIGIISIFLRMGESSLILPDSLSLQRELYESGVVAELSPISLVKLASITAKLRMTKHYGCHLPTVDLLVERFSVWTNAELANLSVRDIVEIGFLLSFKRGTPAGRLLLIRIRDSLLEFAPEKYENKDITIFLLYLAKLNLYSYQACDLLFRSSELTEVREGVRCISRDILHKQYGFTGAGPCLLALQGLLEVNCPDYNGQRLEGGLDLAFKIWLKHPLPSAPEANPDLSYVKRGLKVYRALEAVLGRQDMVQETYVLPHNTVLNYVALIGQDGSPLPLPQFFTDQPLDQVKRVDGSLGTWLMVTQVHPAMEQQALTRVCGIDGLERVARKLGFTPVIIPSDETEDLSEADYHDYVKKSIRQQCENVVFAQN